MKNRYPILSLLCISLVIRFWFSFTHVSFDQDIARDAYLIKQRIINHQLIVDYGPKASVGNFYLPPFYYQLHVWLSLLTDNHPLVMKWYVTALESVTPVLLYLLLTQFVKKSNAFAISFLYIIAYQPLTFGTMAWNPNTIPFFALLTLYSMIKVYTSKNYYWSSVAIIAVSIAVQLHYQATVLAPFLLACLVWQVHSYGWSVAKYWLIGLGGALVLLAPYFHAEVASDFSNTKNLIGYFSSEHSKYFDRVSKPTYIFSFFPRFFDRVLFKHEQYSSALGYALYYLGGFLLIYQSILKNHPKYRLLLVYFVCVFLMLRVFKGDKIDYYMSTLFVWPFVLMALLSEYFHKYILIVCFGLICFMSGKQLGMFTKPDNDLIQLQQAMSFLDSTLGTKEARIIFHSDDLINTTAYGINQYTSIKINDSSQYLIDVCDGRQRCVWDQTLQSKFDRAFGLVADFKSKSQYQYLAQFANDRFVIVIGKVNQVLPLDDSEFIYQGEYGSDFLL